MERALGLICGAGTLPAHVASEARRQGWRVVAFAFGEAPRLAGAADRAIASRLTDIGAVLDGLRRENVSAVVFVGVLSKGEILAGASVADLPGQELVRAAGGLSDRALAGSVLDVLGGLGIEVLDQRTFLGPLLVPPGLLAPRAPSDAEWSDIRLGLRVARECGAWGVGQAVVVKQGVVVAVEGIEGTSETIRRGCKLAGPGATVVKAVPGGHDYRFDIPTIGAETMRLLVEGRASVLAAEAERVLLLDRPAVVAEASRHGVALVSLDPVLG